MKKLNISAAVAASIMMVSTLSASELSESLSNGIVDGDLSITYESRNQDKEINSYYSNTSYAVGSIGLNYKTDVYKSFSASVGFRAYNVLYEDDKKFVTSHGIGDATERFYDDKDEGTVALSKAYIAYDNDFINIKVGKQDLSTEWLTKIHDAVTIYVKPTKDSEIELIWTKRRGRVYARDLRPMVDLNHNKGIYKLGLKYNFTECLSAKAYGLDVPDSYSIKGLKVNIDKNLEDFTIGGMVHTMKTKEDTIGVKDGEMLELKAYGSYLGYTATLGYVETGKENGWGSAANSGDKVVPFEEGDQMYVADSKTTYFMLNKTIANVNLTGLYGVTEYGNNKKNELDVWASYPFTKEFSTSLGYTLTNEDSDDLSTTDMEQLNLTLTYKF